VEKEVISDSRYRPVKIKTFIFHAEFMEHIESRKGEITEIYNNYADTLENHPDYHERKSMAVPGEIKLEQYVTYCRERAAENYTNETAQEAEERFEKFLALLD
jgi:hypothetical protein